MSSIAPSRSSNRDNPISTGPNACQIRQRTWPVNRSYATFREWFDVEIHSIVLDASDDDIIGEAF